MPTKLRFLGNVGEHNPKQSNIYVAQIQDATVPALNGRLVGFSVRSNVVSPATPTGLDLAIQEQRYISDCVNVTKTTTFPESLIPELITFEQFQSLDITSTGENFSGTRISLSAFSNDISALALGYQAKALGTIRGGGVTLSEMEDLLNYDLNGDDIIGEINGLKNALANQGSNTSLGFLDGIKDAINGIHPQAWTVVKTTGYVVGGTIIANIGTRALVGKPLIGKGGLFINTK